MTSKLTFYVMAYDFAIKGEYPFIHDNAIDWAYEMLLEGYESPHLSMLAGLLKPTNYFETKDYIRKALAELGIPMLASTQAIKSLSIYHIICISEGSDIRENLSELMELSDYSAYPLDLGSFIDLHYDWSELRFDDNSIHLKIPEARLDNIDQLAIDTAKEWLESLPTKFSSDS